MIHTTKQFFLINCLLLFCCFNLLTAQKTRLQEEFYSVNEGLSDRHVEAVIQDNRGVLWVGTDNGLNSFDGYAFNTFNQEDNLSASSIIEIQKIQNGHLVLCYFDNNNLFDFFDPETHQVQAINLLTEPSISGIPKDIVFRDSTAIFVVTLAAAQQIILHQWNGQSFSVIQQIDVPFPIEDRKIEFKVTYDAHLWMRVDEVELWEWTAAQQWINHSVNVPPNDKPFQSSLPTSSIFFLDSQQRLWTTFYNQPGVYIKYPNASTLQLYEQLPTDKIYGHVWEDEQKNLLITANVNHRRYAETQHTYCILPDETRIDFSFLQKRKNTFILYAYAKNFTKHLFLGIDTGLSIIKNNYFQVNTYLDKVLEESDRGAIMRGITEGETGTIYTAESRHHWYKIDTLRKQIDTISIVDENTNLPIDLKCSRNLIYSDGYVWGTACGGDVPGRIIGYNTTTLKAKIFDTEYGLSYIYQSKNSKRFFITGMTEDKTGVLLNFDPQSGRVEPFPFPENINPLTVSLPYFLYESQDQLLWIGTGNGLFYLNTEEGIYGSYDDEVDSELRLPGDFIMTIHEDEDQRLWLGTNKGLVILDRNNNAVKHYSTAEGLPNNVVCGILPDQDGNYWLSTFNGLSYFDAETELFRNFYASDGLSHDEFNITSFYKDASDRFYFGGVNGLNVFRSADLLRQVKLPPPILTSITRFDNALDTVWVEKNNLSALEEIVIEPSIGYFQVNFSALQYVSPQKNQYQIKLAGLDSDWVYLGKSNFIRYNFLPAGNYTLQIRSADSRGNWSAQARTLRIQVKEVFYKTWWFIIACTILLTALLFSVRLYHYQQRLKAEMLRTKISSDLHDEVSGLLSGIAMQTDILQLTVANDRNREKLKKMGQVSRSAMSRMSDVIWSIDARKDQVEDLLHRMQAHAEELLTPLQISYDFEIENIPRQKQLKLELRQNLYFIFKEAINNIAKHSNASKVDLSFKNVGQHFIMSIRDNGNASKSGMKKAKKGQGLSNLQLRAERIGAKLSIDNSAGYLVEIRGRKI